MYTSMNMKLSRFFLNKPNYQQSHSHMRVGCKKQHSSTLEWYHCLRLPSISKNKQNKKQTVPTIMYWMFMCTGGYFSGFQILIVLNFQSIPMAELPMITETFQICFSAWQSKSFFLFSFFKTVLALLVCLFFQLNLVFFCLHPTACGMLVLSSGIELMPSASESMAS